MSDLLIPVGYGREYITIDQAKVRFGGSIHPEFARRGFNWLEAKAAEQPEPTKRLGIGSGIRLVQPTGTGFAPAGKSFHLRQRFRSGLYVYSAWDLVIPTSGTHSSGAIPADRVPLQGSQAAKLWGVHINVGEPGRSGFEPWHLQCVEMDGYDGWVARGRPDPSSRYVIPVIPEKTKPPEPTPVPPTPTGEMVTVSTATMPVVREGTTGPHAKYAQNLLNDFFARMEGSRPLAEDGQFGQHSAAVARVAQAKMGIAVDGVVGAQTYGALLTHVSYPG